MVRVKICGLTRLEDASMSLRLGAWALGFIFYERSPRFIAPEAVADILTLLQKQGLKAERSVGVFVNCSASVIRDYAARSGIDTVQLHGDEPAHLLDELEGLRVFKAFRLRDASQLDQIKPFEAKAEALLFDAAAAGQYGGSGQVCDWDLIAKIQASKPIILSGGIGPNNALEAYEKVKPYALDLSSGVEQALGIKDPAKLQKLFQQLGAAYAKST